ncbi:MAG: aminoglycoside phosphotransferase family protein, partial [Propionibacteriaceae bacterium]|nr:aminoglycoside phosphotransferase family protein [Propionibacteriaceae bacterium]
MARVDWFGLPGEVRQVIEDRLGSTVVAATSQATGFSPGIADRVRLADGRRVFLKVVFEAVNPD